MMKYVLSMDLLTQSNNISCSGKLGHYHYKFNGNSLSLIYPKKANITKTVSFGFEMDLDLFGLISLMCLAYEFQITTSVKGYLYFNEKNIDRLIQHSADYDHLLAELLHVKRISSLDGSDPSLLFSGSMHTNFTSDHLTLGAKIVSDMTPYIHTTPYKMELFTQLNYWRRAHDLNDLNFGKEAFLNYFKIIENILKDTPKRKLEDSYIKSTLKKLRLARFSKHVRYYRDIRNKLDVGHSITRVNLERSYDQYLDNMEGYIWNHLSDLEQFTKVLILHNAGFFAYTLRCDGGLLFASHKQINRAV